MVLGNAISIASSNETSEPFSSPLMCVSEADKGRVCAIGSYEMFRDKVGGGFSSDEHPNLTYNIFNWLISEYRSELRENGAVPALSTQPVSSPSTPSEIPADTERSTKVDIGFSMKISRKSELFELLKIFQNQIDTIKNTIDKLVKSAEASENEIVELKENYSNTQPQDSTSSENNQLGPFKTQPESISIFDEPIDSNLTSLPPKPASLQTTPTSEVPIFKDSKKSTSSTKSKKKPSKSDLLVEKKSLEAKSNSVKSLIEFVEKKYEAGDLDDKSYTKRINQLKADLKKVQKRLDEINTML